MTEMENSTQPATMAPRLVLVALLISTVPVGMGVCSGESPLSVGEPVSFVSSFFACLRVARDVKVGRAMARKIGSSWYFNDGRYDQLNSDPALEESRGC